MQRETKSYEAETFCNQLYRNCASIVLFAQDQFDSFNPILVHSTHT